jgi:hypothetical protein
MNFPLITLSANQRRMLITWKSTLHFLQTLYPPMSFIQHKFKNLFFISEQYVQLSFHSPWFIGFKNWIFIYTIKIFLCFTWICINDLINTFSQYLFMMHLDNTKKILWKCIYQIIDANSSETKKYFNCVYENPVFKTNKSWRMKRKLDILLRNKKQIFKLMLDEAHGWV